MNNYAISSAGIGTALQKSAAALASANNSLDESIALITAGNSVVQNPEIIGTTMKTISMFLRASKTEAEEAGIETEGMAESVSKLREEIKALSGIDIMFDEENYKSTYQILKEISEVWENISDVSQANILEKLGGKRNANVVASVIENFDVAEQSLQTSLDAAGSAMQENEKYLNSIEGHINKLTVAYEDLSKTVIESDLLKTGIDFLTSLTSGLNGIMDVFGALPTAVATATAAASAFKNVGIFRKEDVDNIWKLLKSGDFKGLFNGGFNGLKERLGKNLLPGDANNKLNSLIQKFKDLNKTGNIAETELKNITDRAYELGGSPLTGVFSDWAREGEKAKVSIDGCYKAIINGNTKGLTNISSIIKTFNGIGDKDERLSFANQVSETNEQLGTYLKNIKDGKAATSEYIGMQIQATAKTVALTVATAALNAAISLGASLIIQGIVTGLDNMIRALDNAIDKTQSAQDSIKESEDKITSINDELKTTETRLKELSSIRTPTLFEQDEINRLKEYNKELRRSLNLEQRKLDQEYKQANDESRNAWNTIFGGADTVLSGNEFAFSWNYAQGKTVKQNQDALERYRRLLVQIEEEEKKYLEKGIVETETSRLATMRREAEALESQLNDFVSTVSIIRNGLDPEREENKWIITLIDNFIAAYDKLNELPEGKTFTDIWNSADYVHITNDLKKLATQGKLTEETFSHVAGINQFTDALAKIGIYNVSDIIAAIMQWVVDSGNAAEVASLQLSDYAKQLEGIKDILDSKSSMRSNIQSAFDKIMNGESLTDDDILKFKEYPEIFSQIEKTTDGWTISVDTLSKAYSNLGSELRDAINGARNNILSARDTQIAQFNENKSAPKINSAEDYQEYIAKQDELTNAIQDSDAALNAFDVLLDLYSDTLRYTAKETDNYNDVLKEFSSNISTGVSAQKEMNESGTLSASTVSSLLSLGEEYVDVLYIENGQIKLNVEAYQDLTKAKLADEEATLRLAKAEVERAFPSEYMAYGKLTEQTQKLYDDINTKLSILERQGENIDDIWNKALSGSGSDTTDSDYSKALNKLKRANTGTIEAEKEFITQWEKLNEETYKNTNLEKYEENLQEIEDYIEGLNDLLDEYLEKWGKLHDYDENDIGSRQSYLAESQRVNYETYGDPNSIFYNLDTYEKNLSDQAKYEAETLKKQLDKELITYDTFMSGIRAIREKYRDRDGNYLLDMSFVSGYEDVEKDYAKKLEDLRNLDNGALKSRQEFIKNWKKLNDDLWKDVSPAQWKKNNQEIADYSRDFYKDLLENGTYSAEQYREKIKEIYFDPRNKDLLGLDWYRSALKAADNKEFSDLKRDLAADGDKTLENVKADAEALNNKNYHLFHDDPETLRKNGEEVFNTLADAAKDALDKGLITPEEYLSVIDTYANTWQEKLGLTQAMIDKAKESLTLDDRMYAWDKKHQYDEDKDSKDFALRQGRIFEYRQEAMATYGPDGINDTKKLEEALKEADKQQKQLNEDFYEFNKLEASNDNDNTLAGKLRYAAQVKQYISDTYGDESSLSFDKDKYKSELKEVLDYELAALTQAYKEGEISTREYVDAVSKIYKEGDILGANYIAEKQKEVDEVRAEHEKLYWTQQKQLVEEYYDSEIEKLREVKDEHDRIAAAEKLRLNLIKARKKLEEAQSQRNQLIFRNGTFEYMADPDAIKSAAEEVTDAIEAIKENELEEEIRLLTEQKDAAVNFYTDIINVIDAYINKTEWIAESDSEFLKGMSESKYGQQEKAHQEGKIAANTITNDELSDTGLNDDKKTKAKASIDIAHENDRTDYKDLKQYWADYINKPIVDTMNEIKEFFKSLSPGTDKSLIFGASTLTAQDIAAAGLNNVVIGGTANTDNSVNVGDIHMTIQGGTTREMLDQFANQLSTAIGTLSVKATV